MSFAQRPENYQFIEVWGSAYSAIRGLGDYLIQHPDKARIEESLYTQREDDRTHAQLLSKGLQGFKEGKCVVVAASLLNKEMEGKLMLGGLFTYLEEGGPNFVGIIVDTDHPSYQEMLVPQISAETVLLGKDLVITSVADAFIGIGQALFSRQHLREVGATQKEVETYFLQRRIDSDSNLL